MTEMIHPRMRERLEQVERAAAWRAERELAGAIDELERYAAALDARLGVGLGEGVADVCARLRRSLDAHAPQSPAGRIVRRFLPDRLAELRADCEQTEAALAIR